MWFLLGLKGSFINTYLSRLECFPTSQLRNWHLPTCWRAIFFGKQFHKYNFSISTCTHNISLDKHYCQVNLYVATRWCSSALIKRRKRYSLPKGSMEHFYTSQGYYDIQRFLQWVKLKTLLGILTAHQVLLVKPMCFHIGCSYVGKN